jgi:hypothetical protein
MLLAAAAGIVLLMNGMIRPDGGRVDSQRPEEAAPSRPAIRDARRSGVELLIVAFEGLRLSDGSSFSQALENGKRRRAKEDGDVYALPPTIRWLPMWERGGPLGNHTPDAGAFLYYDPEFWDDSPEAHGRSKPGFTGADLHDVRAYFDHHGFRGVRASLEAGRHHSFERYTSKWVGRQMAVVIDGKIIIAPVIEEPLREDIAIMTADGLTGADQDYLIDRLRKG